MKFVTEIWHPNVDKNGDACISILHEPGEGKYGYEKPEEHWLPIHTVETITISVISMLPDPNGDSPANVDAAKEWREDRNGEFERKVARCAERLVVLVVEEGPRALATSFHRPAGLHQLLQLEEANQKTRELEKKNMYFLLYPNFFSDNFKVMQH
ncbi:hypothetical protein EI555_007525 [Monodon monoceros]|uniref:UBC core domain-containing protein n=1 Tax=Monodon monoceros TaxID=40151 RepID=A0A4U1F3M2_MONMO|nr:hypothetical protein EI555_007525 [Monodon monoceros]